MTPQRLQEAAAGLWLVDPVRIQAALQRALAVPCPSAREVAKARRRELAAADALAAQAVPSLGPSAAAPAGGIRAVRGKVGVIGVHGPIEQRMSTELSKAGGTSCEYVSRALDVLLNDAAIGAIVLHVDSPGGNSYGVEELSDKIFAAREQKPVYACADSLACSAALWLASSAGTFVCTPGGDVGSVGVYMLHMNKAGALAAEGVKATFVKAGQYKTDGNPLEPLSPEAQAHWQSMVDQTYAKFTGAVARNRGVAKGKVEKEYGQGRTLSADEALAAGMIDRVMTFEALMNKLTGGAPQTSAPRSASAQVLKLRQDQRRRRAALLQLGRRADDGEDATPQGDPDEVRPGMTHDSETSDREPAWEDVDQDKLPDQAFADPENRQYAHHWVEGGGDEDGEGRYTTGTMFCHREGLRVASADADADGADDDVQGHLAEHRQALGMEGGEDGDKNDETA